MNTTTIEEFRRLVADSEIHPDDEFSFPSRLQANDAADVIRFDTALIVTWIGPQQFMVR